MASERFMRHYYGASGFVKKCDPSVTDPEKSVRCPVCCVEPGSPCLHPRRATTNPRFWEAVHTHRARIIAARLAEAKKQKEKNQ